jgi:hypothetical protein
LQSTIESSSTTYSISFAFSGGMDMKHIEQDDSYDGILALVSQ